MIKELDRIILNKDIPASNLKKGDIGTVVMVHNGGEGYEVEFVTLDGSTITVETLSNKEVREIRKREIAHARVI
jgi:ATP-dependent exoDNAse (exonuclease V) alpha subunit